MTDEQKAAFINAQAAMMNGRIAEMVAANMQRAAEGSSMAYSGHNFYEVICEYEPVIGHNACLELFHDLKRG